MNDVIGRPSPTPDREKRCQELRPPFCHILRISVVNFRASGSSVRGSRSTVMKRRARSSETVRPLPVRITKADAFKGTICDRPRMRTRAGRSVIALARRSDFNAVPLRLSRNRTGPPPISSAAIRFSSSSAVAPPVTACGWRPNATDADASGEQALAGAPARHGRRRTTTPGESWRLGRHTAVRSATRNENSSPPVAFEYPPPLPSSVVDGLGIGKTERLKSRGSVEAPAAASSLVGARERSR